jgi:predicted Zn-dependent protease
MGFGFFAKTFLIGILPWYAEAVPLKFKEGVLLRDSEIESILEEFMNPALKALGAKKEISLHLVCSDVINAFATADRSIYLTTGILMNSESPEELLAVLLHELGHIEGHHSISRVEAMKRAAYGGLAPLILGLIAAGLTQDISPLILGAEMQKIWAHGSFTGFTRGQESMADQFALKMFHKLNWPVSGFTKVMERFAQKERSFVQEIPLYLQTHPFSKERYQAAVHYLRLLQSKNSQLPEHFRSLFDTAKIKIIAFSTPIKQALHEINQAKMPESCKQYGRAIVYYRMGKAQEALQHLDVKTDSNPFVHELKAQILFEARRLKEALASCQKALKIRPWDSLLCGIKAQILIEIDDPKDRPEAIRTLERVLHAAKTEPDLWYWLGVAYGRQKNVGRMHVCFAEHALGQRNLKQADFHLSAAKRALKPYDRYSQRAKEIESELSYLKNIGDSAQQGFASIPPPLPCCL